MISDFAPGVFGLFIFTTPPLDARNVEVPPRWMEAVVHQGYNSAEHGDLIRLTDDPDGNATWIGTKTYLSRRPSILLHPIMVEAAQRRLIKQKKSGST